MKSIIVVALIAIIAFVMCQTVYSKECPLLKCKACDYGYKYKNGCRTCECCNYSKPCAIRCAYGLKVDRYGCQLCKCKPKPKSKPTFCPSLVACTLKCKKYKKAKSGCLLCACKKYRKNRQYRR
ncbi:hypothetical protein ABK040_009600 [Willaertia magna]